MESFFLRKYRPLMPILAGAVFLFSFLFPASAQGRQGRYGGSVVFSTISDPKSFNEVTAQETSTTEILQYVFEGLTRLNPYTLQVEPNLAKRWDVSADGLTWTFHLRDDVRWNDGQPFTADDIVFTFNDLIYNPDIPSSARDIFTIGGKEFKVTKIDNYTVRFVLPVRFAPFLRGMTQAILPQHKLKEAVKDGRFNFTWGIDTPPKEIVGTGPFRISEYHPGERIVLKRNPYYWKMLDGDRLPYLDQIIYLIVQNQDTSILKFLEGELDYVGVRGSDYPLLKPLEDQKHFKIYEVGPDFGSQFVCLNQNDRVNPDTGKPFVAPFKLRWFRDVRFRRAIARAVDKKRIIEILKNGLGYSQNGPMSPSAGFFYNPNVVKYDYDLDASRKLLSEMGLIDRDGDGYLEDADGHRVEFNFYTNSNSPERIQIAGIIRNDLEKLGMKVNFLGMEFNTLVSKLNVSYDWEMILLGLTGGVEPHFGNNVWQSSGQLHMWNPGQKTPSTEWEKRVDEIFVEGVQILNENRRKKLYDEWQLIVSQQLPFIYTVLGANIFAVRDKFGNLDPTPLGGAFHNIEEIYIKE